MVSFTKPFADRQPLTRMKIFPKGKKDDKNLAVDVLFNPKEYTMEQSNAFAEIGIPGLEAPVIQFVRGNTEKLTFELLVDTTNEAPGTPGRDASKHAEKLQQLARVDGERHAPPIVVFEWSKNIVEGVIESVRRQFVLFDPDGTPLRVNVALGVKRYRTVIEQLGAMNLRSPDRTKTVVVRHGDTLPAIAHEAYGDASQWREIATANNLRDAADLSPGAILRVPRIEEEA